jgi:outer membrane protein TolC
MLKNLGWIGGLAAFLLLSNVRAEIPVLTLSYCLDAAMQHNRQLSQTREKVHEIEGERIFVRSRFMPHLELTANYDAMRTSIDGETDDHMASALNFSQRLFEFGPHAAQEVALRANLRKAVYDYEDKVFEILSRVWQTFHLILLQDQQIATRYKSKEGFQEILEREKARFGRQLTTENDVLNAELNVLRQDQRINSLQRQQFDNKMDLLRLIGRSIGAEIKLEGRIEKVELFSMDMDRTVELALQNSVQIALNTEQLEEQERVVREVNWEYSPDIALNAGVNDGRRSAAVEIDRQNQKNWGVDVSSEFRLNERQDNPAEVEDARWFTQVEARIPIFEGGARMGEETKQMAQLRAKQVALNDLQADVDLRVRKAYQLMHEILTQKNIQERSVEIARRRLEINQTLKERGLVDDNFFENVRNQFFDEQDRLFGDQANYIERQANLRRLMGYFE